jgi:lipopolysaccharide/colanic/teichoic acid biosynthesis glycosyltransferase
MSLSYLLKRTWWPSLRSKTIDKMDINLPWEFKKSLQRECARADRVGSHFAVVQFNTANQRSRIELQVKLVDLLKQRIRMTDELGWLDTHQIGVLLYNSDAKGAIRFAKDLKNDGSGEISHIHYEVYTYPPDQPDNSDHNSGFQLKHKMSNRKLRDVKSNVTESSGAGPEAHLSGGDHPSTTKISQNNGGNLKVLIFKVPLWKRVSDIAGAVIAVAVLSPVFLIVSLYIKLVSPGPVFFKQERIGYGGKIFQMWKFRTMKANADSGVHQQLIDDLLNNANRPMIKLVNDPRIIPLGNILRKFCIDELPQLINVFKGEMSLVGPRPDPVYAIDHYRQWYNGRFDSLPGMTGMWQVSGKNRLSFQQMMRLDIAYARQRSLWLDIKIILSTVPAIVSNAKYDA